MKINTPNKLIILRFIFTIIIITLLLVNNIQEGFISYEELYLNENSIYFSINLAAFILFIFSVFTDFLDGYLARKNNQVTNFGKLFDPLVDKILVNSLLVIFAVAFKIPIWVAILFIIRDLYMDSIRAKAASDNIIISANVYGKLKTLFQFIGISVLFFIYSTPETGNAFYNYSSIYSLSLIPLLIGLFFSYFSAIKYSIDYFNTSKKQHGKIKQ